MACYGVELGERSLPSWLARPAAALVEGVWRGLRLKSTPPVTRHAIDLMCCDCTLNTEKIKAELGYAPILGVDAGLEQLTKHLRAQQEIS